MELPTALAALVLVVASLANGEASFGLDGQLTGTMTLHDQIDIAENLTSLAHRNCSRAVTTNALRRCLCDGKYDAMLAPSMVRNDGTWEPTDVVIGINYRALLDVNEKAQLLLIDIEIDTIWVDARLVYNDSIAVVEFGLSSVSFKPNEIWHPVVDVSQRTFIIDGPTMRKVQLAVYPNGVVRMRATLIDWFACSFSNALFPFDEQNCTQTFEAADTILHFVDAFAEESYDTDEDKRNLNKYKELVPPQTGNGEWQVKWSKSGAVRSVYIGEPYTKSYLNFRIVLKRYAGSHTLVWLILPILLVFSCTICIAIGCAPDERYQFVGSIVVALFLLAVALADKLPVTGNEVPLVTVLYIVLALILFGSLLMCHACAFMRDILASAAKTHHARPLVKRWALAAATGSRLEIAAAVLMSALLALLLYAFNNDMGALSYLTEY